jgi:hypothetical protein
VVLFNHGYELTLLSFVACFVCCFVLLYVSEVKLSTKLLFETKHNDKQTNKQQKQGRAVIGGFCFVLREACPEKRVDFVLYHCVFVTFVV